MKGILTLKVGDKMLGAFPLEDLDTLKCKPQVINTLAGYRIEVSAWSQVNNDPRMQAKAARVESFAPKPIRFRMIGTKPGGELVEELAVFGMNGKVSLPAGTRILKVERITEE